MNNLSNNKLHELTADEINLVSGGYGNFSDLVAIYHEPVGISACEKRGEYKPCPKIEIQQ